MVKDMLSEIQQMSAKSEKDEDADSSHDNDDSDYDDDDIDVRALRVDEGLSRQVNILASKSQNVLEANPQKQVNFCLVTDVTYC